MKTNEISAVTLFVSDLKKKKFFNLQFVSNVNEKKQSVTLTKLIFKMLFAFDNEIFYPTVPQFFLRMDLFGFLTYWTYLISFFKF